MLWFFFVSSFLQALLQSVLFLSPSDEFTAPSILLPNRGGAGEATGREEAEGRADGQG